ncbi:MAG: hypothetical protein AB7G35_07505 [Hyphomicrobiaceae bacterium]
MQDDNQDQWNSLYGKLQQWCNDPSTEIDCPSCSADGLSIEDRSVRPYSEWYIMSCQACGLQETVQIARGSPSAGID